MTIGIPEPSPDDSFRALAELTPDLTILLSMAGEIKYISATVHNVLGYEPDELLERSIMEIIHSEDQAHGTDTLAKLQVSHEPIGSLLRFKHMDGSWRTLEVMARNHNDLPLLGGILLSCHDITERQRADFVHGRVIRALRVLSEVNSRLTHAEQESALLESVCRVIVESGGYRRARVGYTHPGTTHRVRTVAQAGTHEGHLEDRPINWAEKDSDIEITGATDHLDSDDLSPDDLSDSDASPWQPKALLSPEASSIALPLKDGAGYFGTLMIDAMEKDSFDPREVDLLKELAEDLAYGIKTLRARAQYKLQQTALDQSNKRLQAITRRVVTLQEEERRAIAAELHDHVGQNLSALSINLSLIGNKLQATSTTALPVIDDSRHLLESIGKTIRDVIAELRPAVLDDYGVLTALRWSAAAFEARTGVISVVTGPQQRLDPTLEVALLRVTQEALANAAKHASAQHLNIVLRIKAHGGILLIEDDGCGFDRAILTEPGKRSRWGLMMMQERVESIGGRLRVTSSPGKGTCIIVAWRNRP